MMNIKQSIPAAAAVMMMLSACMPIKGRPINTTNLEQVKHICIRPNPKSDFPDWSRQLRLALQKEGVSSQVIDPRGAAPENCRYDLIYKAFNTGKSADTLESASLVIRDNKRQRVGLIKYKLRGEAQQQFVKQPNLQAQTDMLIKRMFKYKYPANADSITLE